MGWNSHDDARMEGYNEAKRECAAEIAALRKALGKLANEVAGLKATEFKVRNVIGDTNWSVLMLREDEARAVLTTTLSAQEEQIARLKERADKFERLFGDCQEARDNSGFIGTVPQCIEYWQAEAESRVAAQEEQIERLTNAVTACRPIIERLIAAEHNVETWGLKQRLAAIDAALAKTVEG